MTLSPRQQGQRKDRLLFLGSGLLLVVFVLVGFAKAQRWGTRFVDVYIQARDVNGLNHGEDIRVAGMAEIGGFDTWINDVRTSFIRDSALDLFPGAADKSRAEYWAGLRPQTPDSVPIIGRSGLDNLYSNTGHGTLGWTMACGSARLLSDLMTGRPPAIDPEGFDNRRFFGVGPGPAKKSNEPKLRRPPRFRN